VENNSFVLLGFSIYIYRYIFFYDDDFPSIVAVDPVGRWTGFGGMKSSEYSVILVLRGSTSSTIVPLESKARIL
jgi:hypothetical protein